ncbi:dCTP pyrophosphatase 1-like protein [Drosera capensis]
MTGLYCCSLSASAMEDDKGVTLEELKMKLADFAKERDWDQFHSPRNLLLALVGEVGELSEIFQWKGEVPRGLPGWSEDEKTHLGEELSDVLLYLVRLSDICNVDLGKATLRKLELNVIKYPVHLAKGSSRKLGQWNPYGFYLSEENINRDNTICMNTNWAGLVCFKPRVPSETQETPATPGNVGERDAPGNLQYDVFPPSDHDSISSFRYHLPLFTELVR